MARICPMIGFGGGPCARGCGHVCRQSAIEGLADEAVKLDPQSRLDNLLMIDVIARWRGGKFERYAP